MSAKQSTDAEPVAQPVEVPFHKQFMQVARPPRNWGEWLERARAAETIHEKLGLLHGAFEVELGRGDWDHAAKAFREYSDSGRIETFFEIADGWADKDLLRTEGVRWSDEPRCRIGRDSRNQLERTESEQRQQLARKAFDMLVVNFFKMPEIRGDEFDRGNMEARWIKDFVFGPLFPVVQNFFRIHNYEKEGHAYVRNLSLHGEQRLQNEKVVVNFLLKLPKFLWSWKDPEISYWGKSPEDVARQEKEKDGVLAMRTVVDGAKPWMIEVLAVLRELDLLEKWILELDGSCLAMLKKIALRNQFGTHIHPVTKDRRVVTIDEACYLGSPAGWLLKKHELMTREHKRLNAIRSAEWKRQDADRTIEKLTK